jgi:predicted nucleic acid-binding protein
LIIVDASVTVQWVVDEDTSALSDTLLTRTDLAAPDFMLVEAANALYRKVFVGDVSEAQAAAGLQYIRDKVELLPATVNRLSRAIHFANEMNHPVYDCLYVALAEETSSRLVTYDRELRNRANHHGYGTLFADLPLDVP